MILKFLAFEKEKKKKTPTLLKQIHSRFKTCFHFLFIMVNLN